MGAKSFHVSSGGRVPVQLGRRAETPAETHRMHALPENPGGSKPAGATSGVSDGRRNLGVVITGGSKGLGLAMAREFMRAGDSVVICGRDRQRLESAVAFLQQEVGADRASGMVCDVSDVAAMSAFADFAREKLPCIDIWINNAGQVTRKQALPSLPGDEIARVIRVNVMGSLLGSQEAVRVMQQQPQSSEPRYHIFNMGFSEWGASLSKSAVTHKASKTAVGALRSFLAEELTEYGLTSIGVHNLSPGMVLTDLLLLDSTPISRRFFNALAEEPESIAAVVVPQMRAVSGTGTRINYLEPWDAFGRIVSKMPQILGWAPARFFDSRGDRVRQKGEQYQENGVRIQLPTADAPVATQRRQ